MTSAVPWRRASLGPPRPQRPPPRRRESVSAPHGAPLVLATLPPCLRHGVPSATVPLGALAPEGWGTPAAKVPLVTGSLVPRLAQSCILGSMSSSPPSGTHHVRTHRGLRASVGSQASLLSPRSPRGWVWGLWQGQRGAAGVWGLTWPAGPPPWPCPHSPALVDGLPADRGAPGPHRQLAEPPAGRPAGQRGQPAWAAGHAQQPGPSARGRGPTGARGRVLQHAH